VRRLDDRQRSLDESLEQLVGECMIGFTAPGQQLLDGDARVEDEAAQGRPARRAARTARAVTTGVASRSRRSARAADLRRRVNASFSIASRMSRAMIALLFIPAKARSKAVFTSSGTLNEVDRNQVVELFCNLGASGARTAAFARGDMGEQRRRPGSVGTSSSLHGELRDRIGSETAQAKPMVALGLKLPGGTAFGRAADPAKAARIDRRRCRGREGQGVCG
jgi:hypothetical protein